MAAWRKTARISQNNGREPLRWHSPTHKHTILRDLTYETVLLKLRRRYHAQVAGWLEAHAGERLGEYLGLIAGHCDLAGERAKAAAYLRRSGEEACRTDAYRDARAAFERALGLLPEDGGAERAALARGAEMDLDQVVEEILAEGYRATA